MSNAPARDRDAGEAPGSAALIDAHDSANGAGLRAFYPLLSAVYATTGWLGLFLAVPPGYATAIFPPAGIAAAAMLVAGPSTLPWTFLGSLLLNFWVGYQAGAAPLATAALAAILIAAASTVQAGLVGWALKRACGYPAALDDGAQVWAFLLLTPLCCLSSASLSLAGLWGLGVVVPADLSASWVSWWVGDTLGVLVVLPLMLVLFGEPRALWRARLKLVVPPMLLFFGLFVAIFIRVSGWEHDAQLLEFRLLSQQTVDKIQTRLDEQEVFLAQLERSFSRAAPIRRADFLALVEHALERFPMLQAVEWAPRIGHDERPLFEAAQRAEVPHFEIREVDSASELRRAADRAEFYPVTYVEPWRGNDEALGLDLASQPDRKSALAQALATSQVAATGPIRLVQERGQQPGLLLLMAVKSGGSGAGAVLVVVRVGTFIDAVLAGAETSLQLRLIDAGSGQELYNGLAGPAGASYRQEFDFGLRRFVVETAPSPAYLARTRGWQSWALLAAGVLGTGLLGALLLLSTGYAHRIHAQVEARTRDLATANRQLRIEMEERRNAEAALRHGQRMEAIGRLTGGIAHDFNNLLTVVSANAELLESEVEGAAARRRAAAILRAAERGERLTRQLLGFSRQQPLRPETVDLRTRTGEIAELLARAMPDNIEMSLDLPDGLWPVMIDPAEFDLAILNIAVNARDAMPDGGGFAVAARNLTISPGETIGDALRADDLAGNFVALTLADGGCGMSQEVLAHAFDPYFTTKDVGAGSGLGLSQVYGFAKQSGGTAILSSEPGSGTTVTLLLPRAVDTRLADSA